MSNKGYPSTFIDEVKLKSDIVSTIAKHLTLQKKGKTYWACCPFHYEKTPSFAVNEAEQFYHCYGCGESGDVIKFIQKYENLSFVEAVKFLATQNGIKIPEVEPSSKDLQLMRQKEKVYKALNLAKDFYISQLQLPTSQVAKIYLNSRSLDENIIKTFNIGYSPNWNDLISYLQKNGVTLETMKLAGLVETSEKGNTYDVFGTRLMFPILNVYGDCIGFTARTLEQDSKFAKYKNSSQTLVFDKSRTIYNIHAIKNLKKEQKIDYIIICEGTIDVIAMHKAGFKNTVACMGTAITNYHAHDLKRYTDKIILCLDGDGAGQNATYKAIDVLTEYGLEVKVAVLKDNLDPDEFLKKYGVDKLKECLENAVDAYEYKIKSLSNKYNLQDSYQKNKFINESLQIITSMETSAQKEIYLKVLSKLVNISTDVLRRDLGSKNLNYVSTSNMQPSAYSNEEPVAVFRQDGLTRAVKFVLASIVHKKDYALGAINQNLTFKNANYQNLYNFVKDCHQDQKTYTISTLFDYFEVDENDDIKQIINFDFTLFSQEELKAYFDECLNKMILIDLKLEQENLTKLFKTETDLNKRREIAMKLGNITKEIKNKTEKKNV
ncbi:MAG: DNA primase [Clostridia bacterium]|nr:DNA primase [Clostridia bacterium]